jgi:hypothetical protein
MLGGGRQDERTDQPHVTPKKKKEGACSYSQAGPYPSFLRSSAWERVRPLVRGAVQGGCGVWGTMHVCDHGERPPTTFAAAGQALAVGA